MENTDETGAYTIPDTVVTMAPGTSYTAGTKSEELKAVWSQVSDALRTGSWNAIYAKSDSEFDSIVSEMIKTVNGYGYDQCLEWSQKEAQTRHALEQEVSK